MPLFLSAFRYPSINPVFIESPYPSDPVADRYYGATHDRGYGASRKWPKVGLTKWRHNPDLHLAPRSDPGMAPCARSLTHEKKSFNGQLLKEANEIYKKATSICVPQKGGKKRFIQYIVDQRNGKFTAIASLTGDIERFRETSPYEASEVIDMSFPRTKASYDKLGYKILVFSMKAILFGSSHPKMTKDRCEEFFGDDSNFELKVDEKENPSGILTL